MRMTLTTILIAVASTLMLSACDMDKNHGLCAQMGLCTEEKVENDPTCGVYGTCKKEDGEEEDKPEKSASEE